MWKLGQVGSAVPRLPLLSPAARGFFLGRERVRRRFLPCCINCPAVAFQWSKVAFRHLHRRRTADGDATAEAA